MAEISLAALDAELSQIKGRLQVAEDFGKRHLVSNAVVMAALFQLLPDAKLDYEAVEAAAVKYFDGPSARQRKLITSAVETLMEISGADGRGVEIE